MMSHILRLVTSLVLVGITATLSSFLSYQGVDTFYSALNLPPLNPPNVVFPIIWPILYVLMIVSFYLILGEKNNKQAVQLFIGQLVLHILWCYLFFVKGLFMFAFLDIVLLFITVFVMIQKFSEIHKTAGYLQYPYLLWLLFATYLNAGVWYLNGAAL